MSKSDKIQEEIAREAYSLYLNRGMADGQDVDDWTAAEKIVLNRSLFDKRSAKGPASSRNVNIKEKAAQKMSR